MTDGSLTGDDITDGSVKNADLEPVESVTHPTLGACDGATNWTSPSALRQASRILEGSIRSRPPCRDRLAARATQPRARRSSRSQPAISRPRPFGVVRWPALAGGASIAQIAVLDDFSGAVVYDGPDSAAADDYISLEGLTFRP